MSLRHLSAVLLIALIGATLGGCTKCGFIWDEGQRSCRSDAPR